MFITLLEEEGEALHVALHGVILVVDPRNALELLNEATPANLNNHLQQQLKYADTILIRNERRDIDTSISSYSATPSSLALSIQEEIVNRKHNDARVLIMSEHDSSNSSWKLIEKLLPDKHISLVSKLINESPALPFASQPQEALGVSSVLKSSINLGGGGVSSGFLAPSLTAHDKRSYTASIPFSHDHLSSISIIYKK